MKAKCKCGGEMVLYEVYNDDDDDDTLYVEFKCQSCGRIVGGQLSD